MKSDGISDNLYAAFAPFRSSLHETLFLIVSSVAKLKPVAYVDAAKLSGCPSMS